MKDACTHSVNTKRFYFYYRWLTKTEVKQCSLLTVRKEQSYLNSFISRDPRRVLTQTTVCLMGRSTFYFRAVITKQTLVSVYYRTHRYTEIKLPHVFPASLAMISFPVRAPCVTCVKHDVMRTLHSQLISCGIAAFTAQRLTWGSDLCFTPQWHSHGVGQTSAFKRRSFGKGW